MSFTAISELRFAPSGQQSLPFSLLHSTGPNQEAPPRGTVLVLTLILCLLPARLDATPSKIPSVQGISSTVAKSTKQKPSSKRVRAVAITREQLLTPPLSSLIRPPEPLGNIPPIYSNADVPRRPGKVYVTTEGLAVGDYFLSPRVVFGTDNRYDDANIRERAMREDMDALQARQRGELREDPLSQLIRHRQQGALNPSEPGFRLASTVHELLQLTLHMPINSLHSDFMQDRPTTLITAPPMPPSPQSSKRPQHLKLPPP